MDQDLNVSRLFQFRQGAAIYAADGEQVGKLDRVVVEPGRGEVTHLVVRQGVFFTEDKVIPVELVETASEEGIKLNQDRTELEDLPELDEEHYLPVEGDTRVGEEIPEAGYFIYYPPYGISPTVYPGYTSTVPAYVSYVERNIPEGTVALTDGADVFDSQEEKVGSIERIFSDPETNLVSHLLISSGLLVKTRKLVPTAWIRSVTEERVTLSVSRELLEKLPEFQE